MEEIWKVYKETSRGVYEVSTLGNIKYNGKIINYRLHHGYPCFGHWALHRAVAETFIPNNENKPTVDHIDRNPLNNSVDNLRWATYYEQTHNRVISEQGKQKILNRMVGRLVSEETKQKLSESHKGKIVSEETRKKISESLKGEKHWNYNKTTPVEVRKKISDSHKGMHWYYNTDLCRRVFIKNNN